MAVRASATTLNSGTVAFPTVAAGDVATLEVYTDGYTSPPSTPAGFALVSGVSLSGPDGGYYYLFDKLNCTGSETTVTVTLGTAGGSVQSICRITTLSGRAGTRTFVGTATQNTSANVVPFSVSATGGTCAAGDDLGFFVGFDPTSGTAGTYTLSSVADTKGDAFAKVGEISTSWLSEALWFAANVSAGASGSVSATAGGGGATAGYMAIVVAYAASAAAPQVTKLFVGNPTLVL